MPQVKKPAWVKSLEHYSATKPWVLHWTISLDGAFLWTSKKLNPSLVGLPQYSMPPRTTALVSDLFIWGSLWGGHFILQGGVPYLADLVWNYMTQLGVIVLLRITLQYTKAFSPLGGALPAVELPFEGPCVNVNFPGHPRGTIRHRTSWSRLRA